jgi:molecular chaperone DnaK
MEKVIGIDLGTTNSCVAIVENGTPVVIPNRGGYKTTPSMVAIAENGKRLVGHIAKRQAITNAENTVYAAKRLIGRKYGTQVVKQAIEMVPYKIVEGPHDDVRVELRGEIYAIPEISAYILQEMKLVAEQYLGEPVAKAVVTVPAYFNDGQRQATKDAGRIAGLDVIRIINEPTAAGLAYGFGKSVERKVAVYDLGGGTFDISILEIGNGVFEVVATAGDTFLGGEDFDRRIIDWLVFGFAKEHKIDLRKDKMALQRLKDAAEKAKCELSTAKETEINLPFIISTGRSEALHLQRTLSRSKLEELTSDLIDRTIHICRKTLSESGIEKKDIEDVILVGGMTRMPKVQQVVQEFFGLEPCKSVHPDEVVAVGAAIQGVALLDEGSDMLLLDVTPHSLGIMIVGGYFHKLIEKNTTVPCAKSHVFTTIKDNQTSVKILVLQGESERAEENELLGEFVLNGLRRAKKGEVEIEVTFEISSDGIVSVMAKDLETGLQQSITVTATSGLTEEEIKRMVDESKDYALELRNSDEFEKAKQDAEKIIDDIEGLFPRVEQAIAGSEFGADAVKKARLVLERARGAIGSRDLQAVQEATESLQRTLNMFRGVVAKTRGA